MCNFQLENSFIHILSTPFVCVNLSVTGEVYPRGFMSALSRYENIVYLTPHLPKDKVRALINVMVWELFDLVKSRSIKVKLVGLIPISIKIEKLSGIIEQLVGERITLGLG